MDHGRGEAGAGAWVEGSGGVMGSARGGGGVAAAAAVNGFGGAGQAELREAEVERRLQVWSELELVREEYEMMR